MHLLEQLSSYFHLKVECSVLKSLKMLVSKLASANALIEGLI